MVTRRMEQSFLRTPKPGSTERECGNGENCQGRKIPNCKPVTLVEFLITKRQVGFLLATGDTRGTTKKKQEQEQQPLGTKKLDVDDAELCVMCRRYKIMYDWINMRAECGNIAGDWIIQEYYNVVDMPGFLFSSPPLIGRKKN